MRTGGRGQGGTRAAVAAFALVALGGLVAGGCSDGGDDGLPDDSVLGSSTTTSTAAGSFEEADAALALNVAATGINLVATDVSLRNGQTDAPAFCRDEAPGQVEPHRTTLLAAGDDEARHLAETALEDLEKAIDACAADETADVVRRALDAYTLSFERLRERIDELLGVR